MKKLLCLGLTGAAIVFASVGVYKNFRIPPLDEGSRRAAVLSATRAECAKNREWYEDRVVVLQASPNFLTAKVNEENITVELLRGTLPQVLGIRMTGRCSWLTTLQVTITHLLSLKKGLSSYRA
jgi:hypothetical protein